MSASPAVICPAVRAWVRIVFNIACCAVMVLPWMLPALMVSGGDGLAALRHPGGGFPALTATSAVESVPSVPTVTS